MRKVKNLFNLTKQQLDSLSLNPSIKLGMQISFLALGVSLLVIMIFWQRLPPEVPMLYSRPYGEEQLVRVGKLLLLPGSALLINIFSFRVASVALETEKLLAQILIWTGCLVSVMATATLIKIVLLVA